MWLRFIIVLILTLVPTNVWLQEAPSLADAIRPSVQKADRVVVKREERILMLMHGDRVLFVFDIVLGGAPEGDKLEEGDWRTPEGRYIIDWRNPESRFYKPLHISYPDAADRKASAAEGVDPGGMIMIHGSPPESNSNPEKYEGQDWTDGCIALNNKDMDILREPVEILP